jgi:hypothetical protein
MSSVEWRAMASSSCQDTSSSVKRSVVAAYLLNFFADNFLIPAGSNSQLLCSDNIPKEARPKQF